MPSKLIKSAVCFFAKRKFQVLVVEVDPYIVLGVVIWIAVFLVLVPQKFKSQGRRKHDEFVEPVEVKEAQKSQQIGEIRIMKSDLEVFQHMQLFIVLSGLCILHEI